MALKSPLRYASAKRPYGFQCGESRLTLPVLFRSRAFLSSLERCDADPLRVARCFVGHQRRFEVYTDYCTHYPR